MNCPASESVPFEPATITTISGLAVAPPIIGRICTGHTERRTARGGVRALPTQDHAFHITTLVQQDDLSWTPHPIARAIQDAQSAASSEAAAPSPLTRIPVRVAYDSLALNLQNRYAAYDSKGRPACVGDGCRARRMIEGNVEDIDCPRPERCEFGAEGRCRNFSKVLLRIEGQDDSFGVFALRTSSYNTTQYVGARLLQLHSGLRGQIAGLPMDLVIRQKTSAASFRQPFSFVDLVEREGLPLSEAIEMGQAWRHSFAAIGFSLETMEAGLCAALARSSYALGDDELEDPDEWFSDRALSEDTKVAEPMRGLDVFTRKGGSTALSPEVPAPAPAATEVATSHTSAAPDTPPPGAVPSIDVVAVAPTPAPAAASRSLARQTDAKPPLRARTAPVAEKRMPAASSPPRTGGPAKPREAVLKSPARAGNTPFF